MILISNSDKRIKILIISHITSFIIQYFKIKFPNYKSKAINFYIKIIENYYSELPICQITISVTFYSTKLLPLILPSIKIIQIMTNPQNSRQITKKFRDFAKSLQNHEF